VEAVEHCLRFAYTEALPASHTLQQLLAIYQQADYLGMLRCCEAVLEVLAASPLDSFGLEEAAAVFVSVLPGTPNAVNALATCTAVLLLHLGDVVLTMRSPELKQQFLELPLPAVLALVQSDELASDGEDSVLALVSCWVHANGPSPDECRQLSEAVRLSQLTPTYFTHVVPALPWLAAHLPIHMYGALSALR
jgi:hypothetical protein